jgi:tetratricopeptide (TPR) repeat protein
MDHVGRQAFASLNNMANIYYTTGRYELAAGLFFRALAINPQADKTVFRLVQTLNRLERFSQADKILDQCNPRQRQQVMYLNLKGLSLLRKQTPQEALVFFRNSLKTNPDQKDVWLHMGIAYGSMNQLRQSVRYLKKAGQMAPGDPVPLLYLIEVGQVAEDNRLIQRCANQLVADFTVATIHQALDRRANQQYAHIGSQKAVCRTIAAQIDQVAGRINFPNHREGALP